MGPKIKLVDVSGEPREPESDGFNLAFPLSSAQQRVWNVDRKRPGDPAYNCAFRWRLQGPLQVQALERALSEIVERHEILRATFVEIGLDPVQLIAPSADVVVSFDDLRSLSEAERGTKSESICSDEATRGFDVGTGPLIRFKLIRLEDECHIFLITMHLLVGDGWSIRVIMNELKSLYGAFCLGKASPLRELEIQYPDYVVWQQETRTSEQWRGQQEYWKSKLSGYRRLEVKGDISPGEDCKQASDIVSLELPDELTDSLSKLSQRLGGTMFITALAAFKALLHGMTGQTDIAVGSELAGRGRTELEALVGLFINHVVLRTDVSDDPTFSDLEQRVRDTTWNAVANQDVPFEEVIRAQQARDEPCPDPFAEINFNCYRAYGGSSNDVLEPSNVRVIPIPSKSAGALHRLNLFMVERESGWRLSVDYNADHYSRVFAAKIVDGYRKVLEQIVANPSLKLSEFQVDATSTPVQADAAEPGLESGAIDVTPEKDFMLPASVVQRRFWLLAKLDPASTKFHMRATVRLAGPVASNVIEKAFQIVVDRHEMLRTAFAEQDGVLFQVIAGQKKFSLQVVSLAAFSEPEQTQKLQALLLNEASELFDLQHGPLFRACLFELGPEDHVLIITTHHIIADGWSQRVVQDELWNAYQALLEDRSPSLPDLAIQYADFSTWQNEWLQTEEASQHLRYWLDGLESPVKVLDFPTDRVLDPGASSRGGLETLPVSRELTRGLKDLSRKEGVTMFTLTLACFATLILRCSNQPNMIIGSPLANRRPETEPLIGPFAGPVPFQFDLSDKATLRDILRCVSEASLTALDHSDLPFESLLEQLRVQSVNGRSALFQFYFLYQTAFLQANRLPGLTISPMPTFSVGTPFELQLAVIERQDETHISFEYNADLFEPDTIKGLLRYFELLLRAMITDIDQNVASLAPPRIGAKSHIVSTAATEKSEYIAPGTDIEKKLADIWKAVLRLPAIGTRDNFFELGGHSLLAAQLVLRMEAAFDVPIDLSLLIVAPSIEQFAQRLSMSLSRDRHAEESSHIVRIRDADGNAPLFCIHGGGGHLLDYRDLIEALPADQPIYGLRASSLDGKYPESVEELAEQYLFEIQGVQPQGPYHICGLSFGGLVAFEIARRFVERGEQVGLIGLFDTGNWAYYRNLPPEKLAQFRRIYMIDRVKKYGRNLVHGRFDDFSADAKQFVTSRFNSMLWKTGRWICRILNKPVPSFVRSNLVVLSSAGQSYVPKSYPGTLVLFRAEGRTAEYGDDMTLGWNGIARDGIVVHEVPGNHLTIMRKPHVERLVESLTPYLARAF